jgi:hypothetical protein
MSRSTRNQSRAALANRLFISMSTLTFTALMAAVVLALNTGRFWSP